MPAGRSYDRSISRRQTVIERHRAAIVASAHKHNASSIALVGSVARGTDRNDSDWKNLPVAAQMIANIGAAAVHLSPTTRAAFSDIPWDDIRDMRNLVAHEYHNIDPEIVWNTLQTDIPDLMRALGVEPDTGIDPSGSSVDI